MTDGRFPEPEPDHPHLGPDGRDPRPENGHPSQSSGFRSPFARRYPQPPTANRQHLTRVGLSALAQPRLTKGGQPYPGFKTVSVGAGAGFRCLGTGVGLFQLGRITDSAPKSWSLSVSLPLSHQEFPLGQQITPATRHPGLPPATRDGALGRVERPRSTAADQGWSALPWTPGNFLVSGLPLSS